MEVFYTTRFKKDFRRLPKSIQKRAITHELWFRIDPFDPRLKTHALKGALSGFHSFSISDAYRILCKLNLPEHIAVFLRAGQHDIYET